MTDTTYPVSVTATVNPHGVCTVSCIPDQANLPSTPGVTLTFTLTAPAGWVFKPTNAVVVASPGTQFPSASVTSADGMSCTLFDANTDSNLYTYTAFVVKAGTSDEVAYDPAIKNGGVSTTGGDGGTAP